MDEGDSLLRTINSAPITKALGVHKVAVVVVVLFLEPVSEGYLANQILLRLEGADGENDARSVRRCWILHEGGEIKATV